MHAQTKPVRVRFAPSPTGHLHIGGLRSALFNWLFARHNNGIFMLRIEDTDRERSMPEFQQSILDSFAWVGMHADEPLVIQSTRFAEHTKVIAQLLQEGKAYRCYCATDSQMYHEKALAANDEQQYVRYPGTCRNRVAQADDSGKPYAVRFKIMHEGDTIQFNDLIRGEVSFPLDQFDDFIIARSDGRPVYNFVVVVDDAYMRISHVIRGEEHLSNTPRQILLYNACNYSLPQFAHLPMILGPSGEKLSKRDGAVNVLDYKRTGYLPNALINYLVRLGWAHGDQEIFTKEELIRYFSLDHVGKKGAIFDKDKLLWMNGSYMKAMSGLQLYEYIKHEYMPTIHNYFTQWSNETIIAAIELYKERTTTLACLIEEMKLAYAGPENFDQQALAQWINADAQSYITQVISLIEKNKHEPASIAQAIKQLAKDLNIPFIKIAQPLRIALIGKTDGPGVFDLLSVIGIPGVLQRLQNLLALNMHNEKE